MTDYTIPLCEPYLSGREQEYVADAISRNEIAQGDYLPRFEQMVAEYVGVRHAVAVSSGTAALHLALLAAGVGPADEVILPALTFAAPAFAVRYCGATPVFVDVEPESWTISTTRLALFVRQECHHHGYLWHDGNTVKAILPVHLLGHPCKLDFITALAASNDLAVIEDDTEALGATYHGEGKREIATLRCLSFNGNKLITTGGGGMVLTDDADLAAKVHYLANQAKDDPGEYVHKSIGYNYRLSNVAAAFGCAQMETIDERLAAKRRIAETYARELASVPGITLMREAPWARSAWWLSTVRIDPVDYGIDARGLRTRLTEARIESRTLWTPLHMQPAFVDGPHTPCPVAEQLWRECLSLPSSVGLSEGQQTRVIEVIRGQ